MVTWEFPVKLPRLVTEEYEKRKAAYVAKYGYTITIPGISDIIHINVEKKPTVQEVKWYKDKNIDQLGQGRYNDIQSYHQKRKDQYIRMLASPMPTWARNIGSVMTFLDDFQDSMTTLAVVGRIAARFLPSFLARAMAGPLGWIMTISDILNMIQIYRCLQLKPTQGKKFSQLLTEKNPFSRRAKARRAERLRRVRPTKGELIEIAQTTDNLFGIGLSLGALVALPQDLAFGTWRAVKGEKVSIKVPLPWMADYEFDASRGLRAAMMFWTAGQEFTEEEHMMQAVVANLSTQVLNPLYTEWHLLDNVEGLENIEIQAPCDPSPITMLMFEELGIDPFEFCGWPHADVTYAGAKLIEDKCEPKIHDSFRNYMNRNQHNSRGYITGQNAHEFAENTLALLEGEEQIEGEYTPLLQAVFRGLHTEFEKPQYLGRYTYGTQQEYWRWEYRRLGYDPNLIPPPADILWRRIAADYAAKIIGFEPTNFTELHELMRKAGISEYVIYDYISLAPVEYLRSNFGLNVELAHPLTIQDRENALQKFDIKCWGRCIIKADPEFEKIWEEFPEDWWMG